MSRNENPPFPLGQTFYNGATVDATLNAQLEGKEWVFEDRDPTVTVGVAAERSNRYRRMRICRNKSGVAILPKLLAKFKTDGTLAGQFGGQLSGLVGSAADVGAPVDEYLPAAGCPDGDLCWVCIEGPATVTTAGSGSTTIAIGGAVVAAASGLVVAQDTSTTGANLFNQIQNHVGRAMTATTGNSQDLVVDCRPQG